MNGQKVYVRSDDTAPTGLTPGYFYVRNSTTEGVFQLSDTPTGAVVEITDAGVGTLTAEIREITMQVYARYGGGQIGLPNNRSGGFQEYLARYLEMGFTALTLGIDEGAGLSLGRFNTIDQPAAVEIIQTAQSNDPDIQAVLLLFNHADSTLVMHDGDVGISLFSDEASLMDAIIQTLGLLVLSNAVLQGALTRGSQAETRVLRSTVASEINLA
jgi:hypothetical protein